MKCRSFQFVVIVLHVARIFLVMLLHVCFPSIALFDACEVHAKLNSGVPALYSRSLEGLMDYGSHPRRFDLEENPTRENFRSKTAHAISRMNCARLLAQRCWTDILLAFVSEQWSQCRKNGGDQQGNRDLSVPDVTFISTAWPSI